MKKKLPISHSNLTQEDIGGVSQEETHDSSDSEGEGESPAITLDTCLQQEEMASENEIINIAPGEGQRPIPMYKEKLCEVLAFPKFFPYGRYGLSTDRPKKVHMRQYFNTRLLSHDKRFSESTEYLFFAQYMTEANQISDSIGISLKKSSSKFRNGRNIMAQNLRSSQNLTNIIKNDEGYRIFNHIRGSPASWQQMQYDCLAKIRQLGPYTWFFTFSVADTFWPEIIQVVAKKYGQTFSNSDVEGMDWHQKCFWLKRNPVIAARHADHMFQQALGHLLLAPPHIIGQILNYDIKKKHKVEGPCIFMVQHM